MQQSHATGAPEQIAVREGTSMRAFVVLSPRVSVVCDVPRPRALRGQAVVGVERVGICGTDAEFFSGEQATLLEGHARFPMRLGHEWMGRVLAVGDDADGHWIGARVTGDTMLSDGTCDLCRTGRSHVCRQRFEIGIRNGWPGALAEELVVPVSALHALPDTVSAAAGAMVEPGANALRAVQAIAPEPGEHVLIWGVGTIAVVAARFVEDLGAHAHVVGPRASARALAVSMGVTGALRASELSAEDRFVAAIDASSDPEAVDRILDHLEPGGRVALVGLATEATAIDTRRLVLNDITLRGLLSGSPAMADTIAAYASSRVDPTPLVAATVSLDGLGAALAGTRPDDAGPGPKIHVDPRLPA